MNIIDAGARYGLHPSLEPLKSIANFSLFEPDLEEFEYLKKKYKGQSNININCLGLSSKKCTQKLKRCEHGALNTLYEINNEIYSNSNRNNQFKVLSETTINLDKLDNLFVPGTIDFLKLDIEGHEIDALKGAISHLDFIISMRIEVHWIPLHKNGATFTDIDLFLRERGFSIIKVENDENGIYKNNFYTFGDSGKSISTDAIWVNKNFNDSKIKLVKFILWLFSNNCCSYALELIANYTSDVKKGLKEFNPKYKLLLELFFLKSSKKILSFANPPLEKMQSNYLSIFGSDLPQSHLYFRKYEELEIALTSNNFNNLI